MAARKKRFDDHSLTAQNARLEALSTVFNRPLLFEEKLQDYSNSFGYAQFARYREMARILAWQSCWNNPAIFLQKATGD